MKHHWEMLLILLSSIQFLAKQGLAFYGHREDPDMLQGNLYHLLELRLLTALAEEHG